MKNLMIATMILISQQSFAATEMYLNCSVDKGDFSEKIRMSVNASVLASATPTDSVLVDEFEEITVKYSKDHAEPMYANYVLTVLSNGKVVGAPMVHSRTDTNRMSFVSNKGTTVSCKVEIDRTASED